MYSIVFASTWVNKGSFPSVSYWAARQVKRNVKEDENIIDMLERSQCALTRRLSARPMFHSRDAVEA